MYSLIISSLRALIPSFVSKGVQGNFVPVFLFLAGVGGFMGYGSNSQERLSESGLGSDFATVALGRNSETSFACGNPSNLGLEILNVFLVEASWSPVAGATSYNVRYREIGTSTWQNRVTLATTQVLSVQQTTDYEWEVQAVCGAETSEWVSGSNFNSNCDAPSALVVGTVTESQASLSWDPVSTVQNYRVRYRAQGSGSWTEISTASTPFVTLANLASGTTFEWQVMTDCGSSTSAWVSGANFNTGASVCNSPSGLTITNVNGTSAQVDWNAVSGVNDYDLRYRELGSSNWTTIQVTGNSVTLQNLSVGTDYEWEVRSDCGSTTSAWISGPDIQTSCPAPSGLVVTNITLTGATLVWDAVSGAQSYEVRYRILAGSGWTTQTVTQTNFDITGLTESTNYEWQVQTNCEGSTSIWERGPNFETEGTPCEGPDQAQLAVDNITFTGATLNWVAVQGFQDYEVRYRRTGGGSWTTQQVTGTSLVVAGLDTFTNYEWQIRTICPTSESDWIKGPFFQTTGPTCDPPTDLAVNNVSESTAELSWTLVAGITEYEVRYRVTGGGSWTVQQVTGNSYLASALNFSTNYEWQVRTQCAQSASDWVAGPFFETLGPPCDAPNNLTVTNISQTGAQLNWDPVTGEQDYEVRYRVTASASWTIQQVTGTTATISGLTESTNYEWQVRTKCEFSNSDWEAGPFFETAGTPCDLPTSLAVGTVGPDSAALSWTAATGEQSYELRYRVLASSAWTTVEITGTSYTPTGLDPETNYEWQVRTQCATSNSEWVEGPFFTTEATPCPRASGLSVNEITHNSAQLNWDAVVGALSYRVRFRVRGTSAWTTQTVQGIAFTATNLDPNSAYEWQIRTNCGGRNSQNVNGPVFQTLETPCPDPTSLAVSEVSSFGATLSWNGTPQVTSYQIRYREEGSAEWVLDSLTETSWILAGLNPVTTFEWEVKSICENGESNWVAGPNFQTLFVCPPPTDLSVITVTSLTAEIDWNDPGTIEGVTYIYNIRYRKVGETEWEQESKGVSSTILSKLEPETAYEWEVQTDCGGGNTSIWVSGPTFTTDIAPCEDPAGLQVFNVGQDSASFRWNAIPGALEYQLRYKEQGTDLWIILTTADTSMTLFNLLAGTGYEWEVRSDCGNNLSQWVPGESFFTDSIPCDPPTELVVDTVGNTSAILRWTGYVDATSYRIRYRVLGTENWITIETADTVVTLVDLEANKEYQWAVQTECGSIPTEFILGTNFTTQENPILCPLPTGLITLGTTEFTAEVAWSSVLGASGYRVRYRIQGTVPWAVVNAEDTTYTLENLTDGSTYEWEVQTACDSLFSDWVVGDPFTTVDIPETCDAPEDLLVDEVGPNTANLAWTGALYADTYEVRYKPASDTTWQTNSTAFSNSILSGLFELTTYEWEVRTLCTSDTTQWVEGPDFTTQGKPEVTLVQPVDSTFLDEGDSTIVEAIATDPDGEIFRIDLYVGDSLLASLDSSAISYEWQAIPKGVYRIKAIATDNDGNQDTSLVSRLFVGFDSTNLLVSDFIVFGNELCFLDSAQVIFGDASIGAVSYAWDFGEGAFPATADSTGPHVVKYVSSGIKTIQLVVKDSLGNEDIRTNTIEVFIKPEAGFAGVDQVICENLDTTVLSASIPDEGVGSWRIVSGEAVIANPDSANTSVSELGLGENVFVWEIQNGFCVSDPDTVVVVRGSCVPDISGDITGADTLCLTDVGITFSVPDDSLVDEYIWTLPPGIEGEVERNRVTITEISGQGGLITVLAKNEFGESETKGKSIGIKDCKEEFELLTFAVYEGEREDILIDWVAQFEQEIVSYTIERSLDSLEFVDLRTVNPVSDLETRHRYIEADNFIVGGEYYYRIRIETVEGVIFFSEVVKLVLNGEEPLLNISLAPNPVVEETVRLSLSVIRSGNLLIEGFDRIGRKVLSLVEPVRSGENTVTFNCAQLTNGVYVLRVQKQENGKSEIIKFMKK